MKKATALLMILLLTAAFSAGAFAAGPDAAVSDIQPGGVYVPVDETARPLTDSEKCQIAVADDGVGEQDPSAVADGEPDAPDRSADALLALWDKKGYPDDIGGAYFDSGTGKLTVLLVNGSESRREELRALAGDPGLGFTDSVYSYNELLAVLDEITKEMSAGAEGLYGAGIGWTSRDGEVTGFGESGKEFRVTVTVDKNVLDRYTGEFETRYGDKVHVEAGEMAVLDSGGEIGAQPLTGAGETAMPGINGWLLPLGIVLFALSALGMLLLSRRRFSWAARTSTGGTVTSVQLISRKTVEEAVKKSVVSPSDGAYERLLERLK